MTKAVTCPYCEQPATFSETSAHLYGGCNYGPVWECLPCHAWVGVHKGTNKPLGRLANAKLRRAKQRAHKAFDPLWKRKMERDHLRKKVARGAGYQWLADQLGIPAGDCHIGMFDVETCERVVEVCAPYRRNTR